MKLAEVRLRLRLAWAVYGMKWSLFRLSQSTRAGFQFAVKMCESPASEMVE